MQGAQQTERLVDVVYGGVQGLAIAHSLESFARGAAEMAGSDGADEPCAEDRRLLAEPLVDLVRRTVDPLSGGLLGALGSLTQFVHLALQLGHHRALAAEGRPDAEAEPGESPGDADD